MRRSIILLAASLAATGAAAVDVIGSPRPASPATPSQAGSYGGGPPASPKAPQPARPAGAPGAGAQPPALLGNCNAGGCWDGQGNRYNPTGDGARYLNKDGRLCTATGKYITCN